MDARENFVYKTERELRLPLQVCSREITTITNKNSSMVLYSDVRIPSLDEWDPTYKVLREGMLEEAQCALRCRPSPQFASQIPRNRSIVGWSLDWPVLFFLYLFWPERSTDRPIWAIICTNILHVLFVPCYYLALLPMCVVWALQDPFRYACITSGSYLVWRELVGLPKRRRYLSSYSVPVQATACQRNEEGANRRPSRDRIVLRFDIPVTPTSVYEDRGTTEEQALHEYLLSNQADTRTRPTRRMEAMNISTGLHKGKYIYLEPGDTLELMVQPIPDNIMEELNDDTNPNHCRPYACNVFRASTLKDEWERIQYVPSKCLMSLLLGLSIMIIGTTVYIVVMAQPLLYLRSLYVSYIRDPEHPMTYEPWVSTATINADSLSSSFGFGCLRRASLHGSICWPWLYVSWIIGLAIQCYSAVFVVLSKLCECHVEGWAQEHMPAKAEPARGGIC